jgi:hypothetical protein
MQIAVGAKSLVLALLLGDLSYEMSFSECPKLGGTEIASLQLPGATMLSASEKMPEKERSPISEPSRISCEIYWPKFRAGKIVASVAAFNHPGRAQALAAG